MQRLFPLSLAAALAIAPIACNAAELLRNPDFRLGSNGWWALGAPLQVRDGRACVQIDRPGSNSWDVILGQGKVALKQGREYTVSFTASASEPTWLRPLVQFDSAPWTTYFAQNIPIGTSPQPVRLSFTMRYGDDEKAGFQFQLGGRVAATVCISQVSLDVSVAAAPAPPPATPAVPPPAAVPEPAPPATTTLKRVRINQVGYLPQAPKRATVASNAPTPLPWQLRNPKGQVVAEGRTRVFGINQASGESVHIADFSAVSATGSGYVLSTGLETSHPFRIGSDIYRKLKVDALAFFQQNRSRAGGWYDARDPGKYTVNGGIALWTLHHLAERAVQRRSEGARDLLNTARWQMDFMLAMQVPDGRQLTVPRGDQSAALNALKLDRIDAGGMVHHKAQDPALTNVTAASNSREIPPQYLHYPSTAATLSLAATAAQCARLWQRLDAPYARRCLEAAERAWDAAVRFPDVYAYNVFAGGGPYDNQDAGDEFYWAAAELFTSTGDPYYLESLQESPHYLDAPAVQRNETGALLQSELGVAGTIVLATSPSELPATQVTRARERLIAAARAYLAQIEAEGYLLPYSVDRYPWGSNANIVNRALILGIAYDLTRDPAFFNGAAEAMNYVLGRNPLDQSYISGHGTRPVLNPHHRFWSKPSSGADDATPPPGMLSGGPNSVSLSDPVATTKLRGRCTGQTCWVDDIGAWTVNEVAVNWNASLLWVATFLDEGLR